MDKKADLMIRKKILGPLLTNCYLIACNETKVAMVIDPAVENITMIDELEKNSLSLKYIMNTHGHYDHIGGNKMLKERYSAAQLLIHRLDAEMLTNPIKNLSFYTGNPVQSPPPDNFLEEGIDIQLGMHKVSIFYTPGHSPGSVSIKIDGKFFSGDTLFANGIGRTDFPGGSIDQIICSIKEKIVIFGASCEILPGHGPSTTIQREVKNNPWLQ
ncbi:MAG: MBL fold metallo-hydrolase [Candidatus Atribacteria bacterium]|nr:MBL fold metallo-hydrolase [Candidatus Atribacteria bacterium]